MLRLSAILAVTVGVLLIAVAVSLRAFVFGDSGAEVATKPQVQRIDRLFVETASSGSLIAAKHGRGRFVLTLHDVSPAVVWFANRPVRGDGQLPLRDFVEHWSGFGFRSDPPNAALSLVDEGDSGDTLVVELGAPRYDGRTRTLRYPVIQLPHATGNLADFEHQRDTAVPGSFGGASLFVDDATAPVFDGCVFEPHTVCSAGAGSFSENWSLVVTDADLSGIDLAGADLANPNCYVAVCELFENVNFKDADLRHIHLDATSVESSDFTGADLFDSHFFGADITGSNFTNANLSDADLSQATLTSSNFTNANLTGADLSSTNLSGSTLTGADRSGAYYCSTTMPSGKVKTGSC